MLTITLDTSAKRVMEVFKKAPQRLEEEIHKFVADTAERLAQEVIERTPRKTGALAQSILVRTSRDDMWQDTLGAKPIEILGAEPAPSNEKPIDGPLGASAFIGSSLDYVRHVEFGTKPHVITPKNGKYLKFEIGANFISTKEVNHPGTTGHFMFKKALEANETRIQKEFELMIDRVFKGL